MRHKVCMWGEHPWAWTTTRVSYLISEMDNICDFINILKYNSQSSVMWMLQALNSTNAKLIITIKSVLADVSLPMLFP